MKLFNTNKNVLQVTTIFLSVALLLITLVYFNDPILKFFLLSDYKTSSATIDELKEEEYREKCDIFKGEWIPNPDAPYYTNLTCHAIHEHQNCMKYGRPDSGYLKWRWKPYGCDLSFFDPYVFLDVVRGRSMAFVGDSIGRNQMQSLMCLLSKVENPEDVSPTTDFYFKRWRYVNYNFTLSCFWSPFLVRSEQRHDSNGPTHTGLFNLYLDEMDTLWTEEIDGFDYLIVNLGHWFFRTPIYHEGHHLVGCSDCQLPGATNISLAYGYRHALQTALHAINVRRGYHGVTFLRTFAPSHFEGGTWNHGGKCLRQRPFRSNETILEETHQEFYRIQLEELRVMRRKATGKKFKLLDVTQAMLLRPDGHPSMYGHQPNANVTLYNDCVHWCLPGPIDSWADFLLHMLKFEA